MKNRKLWVKLLAGFMALLMLLGIVVSLIPTPASAASSSEIKTQLNELKDQKAEIQAQMSDLESQLKDNLSDITDIVDQKNSIDQQVALLYDQAENINQQISAYSLLIADKQDELDEAETRLAELNVQNKERIRAMEAQGTLSYWEVLFKASSFSDLLDRLNMIQEIAAEDQRRLDEMSQVAQTVAEAKETLSTEKSSLEDSRAELDATMVTLDTKRAEADELLAQLLEREDELNALMSEYEQDKQDLMDEIAQKEKEYDTAKYREWLATSVATTKATQATKPSNSGNSGNSGGSTTAPSSSGWIRPCSYVCVSSRFGGRDAPTAGASTYHKGIDLAGPKGTPIYAARSGAVTVATYSKSAGYYVSINHGDGFSSVYMHMTNYVVSAGDYVTQGQLIGYMGSTGYSTGSHLHFGIA